MERFNQIVFLISCCVFSVIGAMEKEIIPQQEYRWVVDINNKSIEHIVGGTIRYYDEYKAHIFRKDTVYFPVECTDSLPIQYCGDQRFFVTSAMYFSYWMRSGQVYTITDPAIKQLAVVRGNVKCSDSDIHKCRVHLYLGLETDRVKLCDKSHKKIYPARVIAFEIKRQKKDEVGYHYESNSMFGAQPFDGMLLMEEVKKQNPQIEFCDQAVSFLKPCITDLLGKKNAQYFDCNTLQFKFTQRYWSKKENALKGIAYSS